MLYSFFELHRLTHKVSPQIYAVLTQIRMRKIYDISYEIFGCACKVHQILGPGLLESVYQFCLEDEIIQKGSVIQHEVPVPVVYNERKHEIGYRADPVPEHCVIIEIKLIVAIELIKKHRFRCA